MKKKGLYISTIMKGEGKEEYDFAENRRTASGIYRKKS